MTPFTLDWYGFAAILLATLALTFWAGIEWCRFTHKRKGLEVDRDVTPRDLLPIPPAPTVVETGEYVRISYFPKEAEPEALELPIPNNTKGDR